MEQVVKFLTIAAAILFSLGLITFGVFIYNKGQESGKMALEKSDAVMSTMAESDYTIYDNMTISGNEVVSVITRFKDDPIVINVTTKAASEVEYDNGNLGNAQDVTNNEYINPSGKFKGKVVRNTNAVIESIDFVQQ